ncbi:hypothetical protein SAMN05216327_11269 [Dyadobacter sp. SG02]
MAFGR